MNSCISPKLNMKVGRTQPMNSFIKMDEKDLLKSIIDLLNITSTIVRKERSNCELNSKGKRYNEITAGKEKWGQTQLITFYILKIIIRHLQHIL